jgi:hypothetical protein
MKNVDVVLSQSVKSSFFSTEFGWFRKFGVRMEGVQGLLGLTGR